MFTVEVLVQMSDLSETQNGTTWNVKLGVSNGEVSPSLDWRSLNTLC